jgi:hypothetical protein
MAMRTAAAKLQTRARPKLAKEAIGSAEIVILSCLLTAPLAGVR